MTQTPPVFSYPVKVGNVANNPLNFELSADEKECRDLAQVWNVEDVLALSAKVRITKWKRDGIRVTGHFNGHLVQNCVVSLEPVETQIEDEFVAFFVPETSRLAKKDTTTDNEIIIDIEADDAPDIYSGNSIDLGEIVAEYAAMAIDPYPKREGAMIEQKFTEPADIKDDTPSPFAALSSIKDKLE